MEESNCAVAVISRSRFVAFGWSSAISNRQWSTIPPLPMLPPSRSLTSQVVSSSPPRTFPRVEQLDVPALQAFLAERLPTYMVPSLLTPLGSLPLTANRKIDRKKLMEQLRLVLRDRQATDEESPPISETERDVAAIWCELLRVPAVGAQSNFFQMGGHSLLVTRMVARLGEQLDVELPLRRVFEARTLRDLAAEIDAYRAARELTVAAPFLGDREEFDL